jgi:hypothetical protein
MVGDHIHADLDHAFNFCGAPNRAYVGILRRETGSD